MISILIISVIIICCVLLVLVVLAQNPKGGGLSALGGGSGSSQMMGVKRTTDFLEKLTWGFAIAILALSLAFNVIPREGNEQEGPTSKNIEKAKEIQIAPPVQPTPATSDELIEEPASTEEGQ